MRNSPALWGFSLGIGESLRHDLRHGATIRESALVTQNDAEKVIRHHAIKWATDTGYVCKPGHYPSFSNFKDWLSANGLSGHLRFRPVEFAESKAEAWFEDELRKYGRYEP